jgi:hypothetical protein
MQLLLDLLQVDVLFIIHADCLPTEKVRVYYVIKQKVKIEVIGAK